MAKRSFEEEREKFRMNLESEVSENQTVKGFLEEKKKQNTQYEIDLQQLESDIVKLREENKSVKAETKTVREELSAQLKDMQGDQERVMEVLRRKQAELELTN
jgi:septal ring factor EnvC (AmiA/AmiB activator)